MPLLPQGSKGFSRTILPPTLPAFKFQAPSDKRKRFDVGAFLDRNSTANGIPAAVE